MWTKEKKNTASEAESEKCHRESGFDGSHSCAHMTSRNSSCFAVEMGLISPCVSVVPTTNSFLECVHSLTRHNHNDASLPLFLLVHFFFFHLFPDYRFLSLPLCIPQESHECCKAFCCSVFLFCSFLFMFCTSHTPTCALCGCHQQRRMFSVCAC